MPAKSQEPRAKRNLFKIFFDWFLRRPESGIILILVVFVTIVTIVNPTFLSWSNVVNILRASGFTMISVVGMSMILITHDLGVVAETCSRVAVMYAGEIVEQAEVNELFRTPLHPYTQGLMGAIPRLERAAKRLNVIRGTVPPLSEMPLGCKFHPRCDDAMEICRNSRPQSVQIKSGHCVSCCKYSGPLEGKGEDHGSDTTA